VKCAIQTAPAARHGGERLVTLAGLVCANMYREGTPHYHDKVNSAVCSAFHQVLGPASDLLPSFVLPP